MAREEEGTFLLLFLPIDGSTFAQKKTSFTFEPLTTPIGFFECVNTPAKSASNLFRETSQFRLSVWSEASGQRDILAVIYTLPERETMMDLRACY